MVSEATELREFSQSIAKKSALRVLIVDDEPLIRWALAEALGARGHHVLESGDARSARTIVRETALDFDVVLLDYRLPDSDGLSLLASIRQQSPRARVILMTAFGTPELVRSALDLGAFHVIGKPFDLDEISDLVAEAGILADRASGAFPADGAE
jgi:DNA-binding NtrC family response regulator